MSRLLTLLLLASPFIAASAYPAASGESQAAANAASLEYFTDTLLINQNGEEVRFFTDVLKDQVVVINFIFTNCEGACPLITMKLRMARDKLDQEMADNIRFVSISIDPERDTPEALQAFADDNKADGNWVFLTGEKEKVNNIVKRLGQYYPDVDEHSTLIIAGNVRTRYWTKIPPNVPVDGVADKLRLLLAD